MKRIVSLICVLVLSVLLVPVNARADVIYEPWDSFYEEHRGECEYVSRNFTAEGPNGNVTLYESPESSWEEAVIENGEQIHISYTYRDADGILWGCCELWDENIIGWIPMDYLVVVYDGISFEEEYGDQFVPVAGSLESAELMGATVNFWKYPGSNEVISVTLSDDYWPDFQMSYTDPHDREWVRCNYYMGIKGYWIFLDDPTAEFDTLFPEGIPVTEPETEPTEEAREAIPEIVPKRNWEGKILTVIAVTAVVAVTAVLLYLLKRKK